MAFRQKLFDSDFALLEYIYTRRNPANPILLDSPYDSVRMRTVLDHTLALVPFLRPTAKGLRAACNRVFRRYSEIGSMEDTIDDVVIDIANLLTGSHIGLTGIDTR